MAVGVLLFAVGSTPYWLASIIVLGGALPGWELAGKLWKADALTALEYRARARSAKRREEEQPESDRLIIGPKFCDNLDQLVRQGWRSSKTESTRWRSSSESSSHIAQPLVAPSSSSA
jgi:hypothetical protein